MADLPVDMQVRPADPNAVIRFPSDPRRLVPPGGCEMPVAGVDAEHFERLLLTKELVRVPVHDAPAPIALKPEGGERAEPGAPTGREPTTPLTTR